MNTCRTCKWCISSGWLKDSYDEVYQNYYCNFYPQSIKVFVQPKNTDFIHNHFCSKWEKRDESQGTL